MSMSRKLNSIYDVSWCYISRVNNNTALMTGSAEAYTELGGNEERNNNSFIFIIETTAQFCQSNLEIP